MPTDATINRHGIRMGTSEVYTAVEALPEVMDSLVVDLEHLDQPSYMPLFVVLAPGLQLNVVLRERITAAIPQALAPRFFTSEILQVNAVPRTLCGEKMKTPFKRLVLGESAARVLNPDAVANPEALAW